MTDYDWIAWAIGHFAVGWWAVALIRLRLDDRSDR